MMRFKSEDDRYTGISKRAIEPSTTEFFDFFPMTSDPQELGNPTSWPVSAGAEDNSQITAPTQILPPDGAEDEIDDLPTIVLPMQLSGLEDAARTDVGQQREHNEDCFGVNVLVNKIDGLTGRKLHARALYILCDGMGGHAGGEVASQLAVDTLQTYFQDYWQSRPEETPLTGFKVPSAEVLKSAVQAANQAIYDQNQSDSRLGSGRMGTTLVMMLLCDTVAAVVHVGDSRLYRYTRKRGLEQVTLDHEVGQREILRGIDPQMAYSRPDAYQLTQALGPRDESFVNPDVQFVEVNEDTLFLLASDGLTDNDLLESNIQEAVDPLLSSQSSLDQGVKLLIDLANRQNGHDNITVLAVRAKVRPNLQNFPYAMVNMT
jgi:protein phosphatase